MFVSINLVKSAIIIFHLSISWVVIHYSKMPTKFVICVSYVYIVAVIRRKSGKCKDILTFEKVDFVWLLKPICMHKVIFQHRVS